MPPCVWMQNPVDSLKDRLLGALDLNKNIFTDEKQAEDLINRLEQSSVTKEVLERSRLGATVNDVRKRIASSHPGLSKRLRGLIKRWQEEVQVHSAPLQGRSGTVTPATPAGISPAIRHRLTTPGGNGYSSHSSTVSPRLKGQTPTSAPNDNGSVASSQSPSSIGLKLKIKVSNAGDGSYSIQPPAISPANISDEGSNLSRKRKGSPTGSQISNGRLVNGVTSKRSCVRQATIDSNASTPSTSFRPKLKTTAEILADVNKSLPVNMAINLGHKETEEELIAKEEWKRVNYAQLAGVSGDVTVLPKVKLKTPAPLPTKDEMHRNKTELMHKFLQQTVESSISAISTEEVCEDGVSKTVEGGDKFDRSHSKEEKGEIKVEKIERIAGSFGRAKGKKRNWYSILPPLDKSLVERGPVDDDPVDPAPMDNRSIHKLGGREVLRLPYVDSGIPDFLQFKFPDRMKYLSDLNWIYKKPDID